jgi:type 1 glutamine amidotransferase
MLSSGQEKQPMSSNRKHLLILLGGTYHDFEGFRASLESLFEPLGWQVSATYDLNVLSHLSEMRPDLVLSYTCLTEPQEDIITPDRLGDEQIAGLAGWVRSGGAFLAVHAATVVGRSAPGYADLLGGAFLWHPPSLSFTVYPLAIEHTITSGIPAFQVNDEFYIQQVDPGVQVHMLAVNAGVAHPMVWSRIDGKGRVAYIAMGHSETVWELPAYRQLLVQAADFLTG